MISRLRRACALGLLLFASGFITVACQKVPLLAPTGSSINLTPSATALPLGGSTDIIAQVIEAAGTPPHEGTQITFTTNLGTVQPSQAETDIGGRVVVKFIAGNTSGTATITALSGGVSVAAANVVKIQIGSAAVGSVSVSASPATLSSSGGTSTITATVADSSGNLLPSVPVTFAIDTSTTGTAGGNGALGQTVVNTDTNGKAQTTLTTNRTTTVSATAGVATTSGTTTTAAQVGRVTVTVNTTSSITLGTPTPNPATVGQTVTLTVTPGTSTTASPIVRTTVEWGDGRRDTFTGLPAAISHTYTGPGSYLILVTGVDALGDSSTTSASVTVNPRVQPTVAIAFTPTNPQAGQVVTFTATVTQGTSTPGTTTQSVQWDFGDGTHGTLSGNSTVIQHAYETPATYVVTVIVTDSTGATASAQTTVSVTPKPNPLVALAVSPNPSSLTQQPVTFTATVTQLATGVTVDHYEWSFGDGSEQRTTTSNTTNHSYTLPTGVTTKTYTASVTAVMSDGTRSTSSIEVRVNLS